jgi:hypothetical protein
MGINLPITGLSDSQLHMGRASEISLPGGSSGGGPSFDPSVYFNVWFDGDNLTQSSNKVSAMADQGSDGNNLSQGTGANQPDYTASDAAYNNQPTVQIQSPYLMSLDSPIAFNYASDWAMFITGNKVTTSNYLSFGAEVAVNNYLFLNANNGKTYFNDGSSFVVANTPQLTSADIYYAKKDGANISVRVGSTGTEYVTSGSPAGGVNIENLFLFYTSGVAPVYSTGTYAQLSLKYGAALSDAHANTVGAELASKYGLTWTAI